MAHIFGKDHAGFSRVATEFHYSEVHGTIKTTWHYVPSIKKPAPTLVQRPARLTNDPRAKAA